MLSDFFRGFCVVSFSGSWCSTTTAEGETGLLKQFALFHRVQCESQPHQLILETNDAILVPSLNLLDYQV